MSEREYEGKLTDNKDGFTAAISDTFGLLKIERGDGRGELILTTSGAESFARWILGITPYGHRSIKE